MSVFGRLRSASLARRRCFSTILNTSSHAPLPRTDPRNLPRRLPLHGLPALPRGLLHGHLLPLQVDGIRQFLEGSKERPELRNERFLSHAIELYGQAGMVQEAIKTFEQIEELGVRRTVKSLNALLFSCILAKDLEELKRIYFDFPKAYGVEPNLVTYNHVIKAFSESGSTSSAYAVLSEMDKARIRPDFATYSNMLVGFSKEEKFEDRKKVLRLMGDGLRYYNVRIQSLCKLKKSDEEKGLLDLMILRGMKPNCGTYSHLIYGGKHDEAEQLFEEMKKRGTNRDSDCYFTVVYYVCEGKDFESALGICKESMEKGWFPDFSTMKSLVNGLASTDKVEEAKELVRLVKEKFPKRGEICGMKSKLLCLNEFFEQAERMWHL